MGLSLVELNKIAANLDFVGSRIIKLDISNSIISLNNAEVSFDVDIQDVSIQKETVDGTDCFIGTVILQLEVSVKSDNQNKKTEIELITEGAFSTLTLDQEEFKRLLVLNGGSALYSIARATLLNVTANVYDEGSIKLPMINLFEYLREKEAQSQDVDES